MALKTPVKWKMPIGLTNKEAGGLLLLIIVQLIAIYQIIVSYRIEPDFRLQNIILFSALVMVLRPLVNIDWSKYAILISALNFSLYFIGVQNTLMILAVLLGFLFSLSLRWFRPLFPILYIATFTGIAVFFDLLSTDRFVWVRISGIILLFKSFYLIYLLHTKKEYSFFENLNYLFMLPHLSIPLFPAIDPQKAKIQSNGEDPVAILYINKKGVQWISLGLIQIAVYRMVYHGITIPALEIVSLIDLVRYHIANYLLIIRLSGLFHICVGVLCLMGYDMPKIFHNYFLAHSLPEIWRRINIYFKDFMTAIFFNPIYFFMRRRFPAHAMVISTILVFVISWFIHSYQWFWIKGYFIFKLNDFAFWALLGVLIAIQNAREIKRKTKLSKASTWSRSLAICGTFLGMTVLWSLWTSKDLASWFNLYRVSISLKETLYIAMGLLALVGCLAASLHLIYRRDLIPVLEPAPQSRLATYYSVGFLVFLLALNNPISYSYLKRYPFYESICNDIKNKADHLKQIEGYYEEILDGHSVSDDLVAIPEGVLDKNQNVKTITQDFRKIKLIPNLSTLYKGAQFSTNRMGFRSPEISVEKPMETIRFLIVGGSFVLGSGVSDHAVFSHILEEKLNFSQAQKYQVINAAVPSYDLLDYLVQFDQERFYDLEPDYLLVVVHGLDEVKLIRDLAQYYSQGKTIPYSEIDLMIANQGVFPGMSEQEIIKKLTPIGINLVRKVYAILKERCREYQIRPIWVYWPPIVRKQDSLSDKNQSKSIAQDLGYILIDLENIYDPYPYTDLILHKFDVHPNALGHQIFAQALYEAIMDIQ